MHISDFFGSAGNHLVATMKIVFFQMLPRGAQIQKVRQEINRGVLKKYGQLTRLEIDQGNRAIRAVLDLKGEKESLEITLTNYRLDLDGPSPVLRPGTIQVSRAWLAAVVKTLTDQGVIPKQIEIKNQLHQTVLKTLLN